MTPRKGKNAPPALSYEMVEPLATTKVFERGVGYYQRGAVLDPVLRGDELQSRVEGSEYAPYEVRIQLGQEGIVEAECSCPYQYEFEGLCKHIVATLLLAIHEPERLVQRPPLADQLADFDAPQLRTLLLALTGYQPGLERLIALFADELRDMLDQGVEPDEELDDQHLDAETDAIGAVAARLGRSGSRQRHPSLNPDLYRAQVHAAIHALDDMRPSEAYWHIGGVAREVGRIAAQAQPYLDAGDGQSALSILQAVTETYLEEWTLLDDSDGEAGGLFEELGELWTEAILSADLTPGEREKWAEQLERWQDELSDYGVDDALVPAIEAAQEGWDDSTLRQILAGTLRDVSYEPGVDDTLTLARLAILQRQGRDQEYLNLALATGQYARYAIKLATLGRIDEALRAGRELLSDPDEALELAQALREHKALDAATEIAEHGLTLPGPRAALARWLRDLARARRQPERALSAALAVVEAEPLLKDYQVLEQLAGERWPALREQVIERLRGARSLYVGEPVQVLLHAGELDAAIELVERQGYGHTLLALVADAAFSARPEWVIQRCRAQAERLMNEGKAKYYPDAAGWLVRVKAASLASGRAGEWRAYLSQITEQHRRKTSLTPLLKELARG